MTTPAGDTRFLAAYKKLAQAGYCHEPGGMEYHRVLGEWKQLGRPVGIEQFITVRANMGPSGKWGRATLN
jgi:hypothetical protein